MIEVMWEQELWGNSLSSWGLFLLIIAAAIVAVKLFSWIGVRVIRPWVGRTKNRLDDLVYMALEPPVRLGLILLGIWIAIHQLVYPDSFVRVVDNAYQVLIVLDITWFVARLAGGLLARYWERREGDPAARMMPVVRRSMLVVVWIVGGVMALSNVGVNISALLGTLGIGGIAFALAAQDTVKNIFGAFTIFTDRPFSIGDTIRVNDLEGTVVDVGVRSTKVLGYDRRIVTIPNYKVADASVVNISSEPMRRVVVNLGLTYDTTPERMRLALDLLRSLPARVADASDNPSDVVANFSGYGDSALLITFIYYIRKGADAGRTMSEMNFELLESFNRAGLEFAFPTQTLYVSDKTK